MTIECLGLDKITGRTKWGIRLKLILYEDHISIKNTNIDYDHIIDVQYKKRTLGSAYLVIRTKNEVFKLYRVRGNVFIDLQ
jgi:hypothetical protein